MKCKILIIIIVLLSIFSSSAYACLIPNRCLFPQQVKCIDFNYETGEEDITLTLRLKPEDQYDNLNLKIANCQEIDKKINDKKEIDFILKCKPSKSDYSYPSFLSILFPEFLSPCPSRISYKNEIDLFDNENLIAKGELFIAFAEPPNYLNSLNFKLDLIKFLSNLLPFIILAIIIYFFIEKILKIKFKSFLKITKFKILTFISLIIINIVIVLDAITGFTESLATSIPLVLLQVFLATILDFPAFLFGINIHVNKITLDIVLGIVIELLYLYLLSCIIYLIYQHFKKEK